jgi:predicted nucleic acid-binding protein
MSTAAAYLLDTNVVLHATRQASPFSAAVDAQFQLRQSGFRPAVCEVTVAELWAFAQSSKWGDKRRALLKQTLDQFLIIPISRQDHNDIWIAATAHVAGFRLLPLMAPPFFRFGGRHGLM